MATHSSILAWKSPMDRRAWQATVHRVTKSRTRLKRLSTHMFQTLITGRNQAWPVQGGRTGAKIKWKLVPPRDLAPLTAPVSALTLGRYLWSLLKGRGIWKSPPPRLFTHSKFILNPKMMPESLTGCSSFQELLRTTRQTTPSVALYSRVSIKWLMRT